METKHTPTPWQYIQIVNGYEVVNADGKQIFYDFAYDPLPPTRDNAAFIVRACNAHDELVSACEAALPYLHACADFIQESGEEHQSELYEGHAINLIENVLRKLGKEPWQPPKTNDEE